MLMLILPVIHTFIYMIRSYRCMKTHQTFSLDTSVVEAFNAVVEPQQKSATVEKLLVAFLKAKSGDEV